MTPADDKPELGPRVCPQSGLPIETDEEFRAAVQVGIDQADRGETLPVEEVLAWVRSWGTDQELLKPRCK